MIQINKSYKIPEVLLTKGKKATTKLVEKYNQAPSDYHGHDPRDPSLKKLKFDSTIYADPTVKEQLKVDQFGKCAYCEAANIDATAFGDVEHFRPKGRTRQSEDDVWNYPGYYWLAYEWENLFFVCQVCNQQFKKNYFPLASSMVRSMNPNEKLESSTQTLLIHPSNDEPEKHIEFSREYVKGKTEKGQKSIEVFGLDRTSLDDLRREHLEKLRRDKLLSIFELEDFTETKIKKLSDEFPEINQHNIESILDSAKKVVREMYEPHFQFANCTRCNSSMAIT